MNKYENIFEYLVDTPETKKPEKIEVPDENYKLLEEYEFCMNQGMSSSDQTSEYCYHVRLIKRILQQTKNPRTAKKAQELLDKYKYYKEIVDQEDKEERKKQKCKKRFTDD